MKLRLLVLLSVLASPLAYGQAVKVHEGNVVSPDGTVSLPSISRKGDRNTGFYYPGADIVGTTTGGVERVRVDASGRVLVNGQTAYGRVGELLEINASANFGGMSMHSWSTTGGHAPIIDLSHSKSATIGTQAAVASGDSLGNIVGRGSDGTGFLDAGSIQFAVDAAAGTNDMPGRITFFTTPDGTNSSIERLRISNNGNIGVGTSATAVEKMEVWGNVLLHDTGADVSSTTSRYIGRNPNVLSLGYAANSGFQGIELGGPASANEGYIAFHTHDVGTQSGEKMRIGKDGLVLLTVPTGSGTNVRTNLANGQIMFANNNDSSVSPAISGRGVSGRNGLVITAFVDPASAAPDQQYQVLSSTASALSTGGLTNKAYIWYADGTEIMSMTRAGSLTVTAANTATCGNICSGTFTATISNQSNLTGTVTATSGQYMQVGKVVTFSARYNGVQVSSQTTASFQSTVPQQSGTFANNITDAQGTCAQVGGATDPAKVWAVESVGAAGRVSIFSTGNAQTLTSGMSLNCIMTYRIP